MVGTTRRLKKEKQCTPGFLGLMGYTRSTPKAPAQGPINIDPEIADRIRKSEVQSGEDRVAIHLLTGEIKHPKWLLNETVNTTTSFNESIDDMRKGILRNQEEIT